MRTSYQTIDLSLVPVPLRPDQEEGYRLAIKIIVEFILEYLEQEAQSPELEDCAH
jgi:hypothetical protein